SEHIARVHDVGALDDGTPYIVLEYLEGTDLARLPRSQLTVGGLIDLVLQACEALAEAHSLAIVHRDIKPANCFITCAPGGALCLKLLDFGISKGRGPDAAVESRRSWGGSAPDQEPGRGCDATAAVVALAHAGTGQVGLRVAIAAVAPIAHAATA